MSLKVLMLADSAYPSELFDRLPTSKTFSFDPFNPARMAYAACPHGPLLGPTLIATIIKNKGHFIDILEAALHPRNQENLSFLLSRQPDVVCLSTTFLFDREPIAGLIDKVRALAPKSKVVFGGATITSFDYMRDLADYCVLGEGESAILPLLAAIESNAAPTLIPGVFSKSPTGASTQGPPITPSEMDSIPFADWGLVKRSPKEYFGIATQRGCRWRCAFCNYPAHESFKLRYRSVDSIISEMTHNYESHGIQRYIFSDSTFNYPEDRCIELLKRVAKLPFKINWWSYARIDCLTAEMVKAMKGAGCELLFFGIDSGSDAVLAKMRKGFTVDIVRKRAELLRDCGIQTVASWIVGFPGETAESVTAIRDLVFDLEFDLNQFHALDVYNRAPIGMRPETFGIVGERLDWKHDTMTSTEAIAHTEWLAEECLRHERWYGSFGEVSILLSTGWSIPEAIEFMRAKQKFIADMLGLRKIPGSQKDKLRNQLFALCEKLYLESGNHPAFRKRDA